MKHLLAALLLTVATPAYAMTQTFTDVSTARYTYTPGQEGIFSVNFTAQLGPSAGVPYFWEPSYGMPFPSTVGEAFICGIYNSQCVFDPTRLSSTAGISWVAMCPSLTGEGCTLTGDATFDSNMFVGYRYSPMTDVTFMFDILSYDLRPFVSSTVTFTGPDPVPLPPALLLFGSALAGLACLGRRRIGHERA